MPVEPVVLNDVENTDANIYKVPLKQWRRWDSHQRAIFNHVYSTMKNNQEMFRHPKQAPMASEYWNTPCWNAAWTAADAVSIKVQGE